MLVENIILLEKKDEYVVKAFGPKIATIAELKFTEVSRSAGDYYKVNPVHQHMRIE